MYTPLSTIINWFKTGLKPTEQQFRDTWNSFRHKNDPIPIDDVKGIENLTINKADLVDGKVPSSQLPPLTINETVTSLALNANILTYKKEDGTTDTIDLSLYLDDSNLARLVSGTIDNATGVATFTRDDNTTFTLDLSSLAQTVTASSGLTKDANNDIKLGGDISTFTELPLTTGILRIGNIGETEFFITPTFLNLKSSGTLISNTGAGSIIMGSGNGSDLAITMITPIGGISLNSENHNNLISSEGKAFRYSVTNQAPISIINDNDIPNKKYVDDQIAGSLGAGNASSGLEAIDEGNGTGWRLIGRNPAGYGNIGLRAVDLSTSTAPNSTIFGATGTDSHAEGRITTASGERSHAEGSGTVASSTASHAEGNNTIASAAYAHAEGNNTIASGDSAHAEGRSTIASGTGSHAEGEATVASGSSSHAGGIFSFARSSGEYSIGRYGTDYISSNDETDRVCNVGNGEFGARKDAFTIYKNGGAAFHPVPLASITNAQAGMLITDSSDGNRLKHFDGTSWNNLY